MKVVSYYCDGCQAEIDFPIRASIHGAVDEPIATQWFEEAEFCQQCAEVLIMKLARLAGERSIEAIEQVKSKRGGIPE